MAEIELSALSKQCLDRRIGNMKKLTDEVSAWERERNAEGATVNGGSIKIMPGLNSKDITLIYKISVRVH
jgi:hypothetical protein